MIALVRGRVAVRRPDHVVVDCQGIGYRLAVSTETLRQVPGAGQDVTLHSHLVVRDDALALYGFATEQERDLFLMLLGVQTVGPKGALAVLSTASPRALMAAIASGEAARLRAPGVGKRTAERIIVELRDKVGAVAVPDAVLASEVTVTRGDGAGGAESVAREALAGLGYAPDEVDALLADVAADAGDGASAEELVTRALRSAGR